MAPKTSSSGSKKLDVCRNERNYV